MGWESGYWWGGWGRLYLGQNDGVVNLCDMWVCVIWFWSLLQKKFEWWEKRFFATNLALPRSHHPTLPTLAFIQFPITKPPAPTRTTRTTTTKYHHHHQCHQIRPNNDNPKILATPEPNSYHHNPNNTHPSPHHH